MIRVMRVKTASPVEGANSLRVYTFEAPDCDDLTVVANLTNVYEVGDTAAIAQVGTEIKSHGFTIERRKVFGIESSGMALGHIMLGTEDPRFEQIIEVGTELDDNCVEIFL